MKARACSQKLGDKVMGRQTPGLLLWAHSMELRRLLRDQS